MTTVLLSGGMDSTVALYWARERRDTVRAIALDYGQRHARELDAAKEIAERAGVPFDLYTARIPFAPMQGVVIPGRNTIMLTIAASYSAALDAEPEVVIGACLADAEGFPDCRPDFILAAQRALSLGLGTSLQITAPWLDRTKAQIIQAARDLPGCWAALGRSWSCYVGGDRPCGDCAACRFRADGFRDAGETDPWLP